MRVTEVLEYYDSMIIEYDIKSCNINVLRDLDIINDNEYFRIGNLPKLDRQINIGMQLRRDTGGEIYKSMKVRTDDLVDKFLEANKLDRELDVMSIVNDAVYTLVPCDITVIEGVEFVGKHKFTSAIRLSNAFTLLYNSSSDILSVKGINDKNLHLHEGFMELIKNMMKLRELKNFEALYNYVHSSIQQYMNRQMDISCYREFNSTGVYNMKYADIFMVKLSSHPDIKDIHLIDIEHNYSILLKLRDLLLS